MPAARPSELTTFLHRHRPAIEKALTIGFDEFAGQVRAFLVPEYFEYYNRPVWDALQAEVINRLETLK